LAGFVRHIEEWEPDPVLEAHRRALRDEMRRAIDCHIAAEKKALYESWKRNYTPTFVDELVRCARNRDAAAKIAGWNLVDWEQARIK